MTLQNEKKSVKLTKNWRKQGLQAVNMTLQNLKECNGNKNWKKTRAPGCIHKFAGKAVRVKKRGGKKELHAACKHEFAKLKRV